MLQNMETVTFLRRHLEPGDFRTAVKCALIQLYIPTDSKGYRCLAITIPMYHEEPEQSLTKEIYPAVARRFGYRSWKRVEKQIRDAIEAGWEKGNPEVWEMYFPGGKRPSNGEFISKLSEMLDLWVACKLQE